MGFIMVPSLSRNNGDEYDKWVLWPAKKCDLHIVDHSPN